jgi:HSP20 family protein
MTLVRWQPLRNVTSLHREMDRLFEGLTDAPVVTLRDRLNVDATAFMPAAELKTDADNVYLQLQVPGLKPEEIDVQVTAYYVVISGERKEEQTTEEGGTKRSEFRYGKFHRAINLPVKIDRDSVHAKYENGILKLTLPKAEDDRNKTVKVGVEA